MGSSKYAVAFDLETVQGRLYYARMAHRLSRAVVAKAYGIHKGTLKNWERLDNGVTTVPYEYIVFASVAFGAPESWLLGETHEAPFPPPTKQTEVQRLMTCLEVAPAVLMRRRLERAKSVEPER